MFIHFLTFVTKQSSTRTTLHKYLKQCQNKANEAPSRQLEAKNDRRTVEALQFMSTRTKTSSCERSREGETEEKVSGAITKVVEYLRVSSRESLALF